jgi:hypothetical protein
VNRTKLVIAACVLLLAAAAAQNAPIPNNCSLVGTWYGGSDYKYMTMITPITGERFAIRSEAVYDNNAWGYKAWTSWSGELVRVDGGRYVAHAISMFTTSSDPQPPPDSFELDGVRAWVEFKNCDTLHFYYDFFGAYFDLNKTPFVDTPDLNYLPPGGINETYRRMPTTCPACNHPAATQARQRR